MDKEKIIIKHLVLTTENSYGTSRFIEELEDLLTKFAGTEWHYKFDVEDV